MFKSIIPRKRNSGGSLAQYEGRNRFRSVRSQFNQMLDDFFNESFALQPFDNAMAKFWPSIDMSETDTELTITAELPGLDEKNIDVSLSNNVLTISGEKQSEAEDKGKDYHQIERSYGSFRRDIALPTNVDDDAVEAEFKNGILTVTLPKTEPSNAKRITVNAK